MADEKDDFQRGLFQGAVMVELKEIRAIFAEHVLEDRRTAARLENALDILTKEVQSFRDWRNKVVAIWGSIGAVAGTAAGLLVDMVKK